MYKNYAIIAIDYLLGCLECGQTNEDAKEHAISFLARFREIMTKDDYTQTYELICRIAGIAK